jgi:class 3 adenylate cyclase
LSSCSIPSLDSFTVLLAAQWVLIFPLDFATSGSAANLRVLLTLRYALGLPLVAFGVAVGLGSASLFRRWKLAGAFAVGWALLGTPVIMTLAVPQPERFLGAQNFGTGAAAIVLYCAILALWGAPLDRVLFGFVLPLAVVGVSATLRPTGQPTTGSGIVEFSALMAGVSAILCAWLVDRGRRDAFLAWRATARERERADNLLKNMLPEAISARLKHEPGVIADELEGVTVLFADIVGFTPLSSRLGPRDLVRLLNDVFSAFDEMARRHGIEKIKTIGDAYMVVGARPRRARIMPRQSPRWRSRCAPRWRAATTASSSGLAFTRGRSWLV